MHAQPMLQVRDVEASSTWYQQLLGLKSGHGGPDYEMLFFGEPHTTPLVLQLHRWDAHEHGIYGSPDREVGNGMSLWFKVADRDALDAAYTRAVALGAEVLQAPSHNPLAHHWEFAIQDPDGYVLLLATPFDPQG